MTVIHAREAEAIGRMRHLCDRAYRDYPEGRATARAAMDRIVASIEKRARRSACQSIKDRARAYLKEPRQLDMLVTAGELEMFPLPSQMPPRILIGFATELLRREATHGRCEIVPIKKINAAAAILIGRYRRAKANQNVMEETT